MADAAPVLEVEATVVAVELPSHATRIQWLEDWEEATLEARQLSRRDRQYYDNDQWTKQEIEKLRSRKQPVLTKNRIARKVNFILGEEISKRVDPVARPRTPQHEDAAQAATDALRYVEEQQDFDRIRSEVFKDVVIEGTGAALVEVTQENGEILYKLRHIYFDRFAYDQHSRSPDYSDAKWLGIVVWMDLVDAVILWPHAKDVLEAAVAKAPSSSGDTASEDVPRTWTDGKRKRLKFVEQYFEVAGNWFRSVSTEADDIEPPKPTEIFNEKKTKTICPLVAASCYVDSDGARYGIVRQLISPQDEINKRSSKTLHRLSVNSVITEDNVLSDPKKFREELAKPDGIASGIRPKALVDGAIQIRDNMSAAQGELQLLQEAKLDIDTIGPSAATIPDLPSSSSGRAFLARQRAASQELGQVFDRLRFWTKQIFTIDWYCIRQWWTEELWLRVTDDQELTGYRFVGINRRMTRAQRLQELLQKDPQLAPIKAVEIAAGDKAKRILGQVQQVHAQMVSQAQQLAQAAQQGQVPQQFVPQIQQKMRQLDSPDHLISMLTSHPEMQEPIMVNHIESMSMDIVIDEAPETTILADEEFDTLSEMAGPILQARPDMAPTVVKLLVKASRLPNKRELLRDLEKGPDEQQAAMQEQIRNLQMQLQQSMLLVNQTKAGLQHAQAQKTVIEAQLLPAKTESEIVKNHAQSIDTAATAGTKTGGVNGFGQTQALQEGAQTSTQEGGFSENGADLLAGRNSV